MSKFSKKGFTLIELLVVIAIVGILLGLIVISMGGAVDAGKDVRRKADIDSMRKALLTYKTLNGSYPVQLTQCNIVDTSAS